MEWQISRMAWHSQRPDVGIMLCQLAVSQLIAAPANGRTENRAIETLRQIKKPEIEPMTYI